MSYPSPTATSRRLLAEEAERFPQWEPTLESTREPEEKLARKEEERLLPIALLSERIRLAIHSRRNPEKLPWHSFGSPQDNGEGRKERCKKANCYFCRPMSQRKGLADLFEAMKLINSLMFP